MMESAQTREDCQDQGDASTEECDKFATIPRPLQLLQKVRSRILLRLRDACTT